MVARIPRLRFYEALVAADFIVVVWLVRNRAKVGLDPWRSLSDLPSFALTVAALLFVGVLVRSLLERKRSLRRLVIRVRALLKPASLLDIARFLLFVGLTSYVYSWLKVALPLLRPDVLFDDVLFRVETALHFGVNPGRLLQGLFPYTFLWRALDAWYGTFVYVVLLGVGWFSSVLSRRERVRFATGFSFLWIAGSWLYFAVPSLGPCYLLKDDYLEVRRSMPMQSALMDGLFAHYGRVRTLPRHPEGVEISPYLGIAAMPSLHVAALAFFALFARRRSHALFLAYAAATTLTFFAAVVSGWHYAIDGYVGLLLAWAAVRLGERFG
jgi:hypothetical protein